MSRRRVLLEENQHTRFFWAELILCELLIEFATSACVALRVRVGRCVCVCVCWVCVCVCVCVSSATIAVKEPGATASAPAAEMANIPVRSRRFGRKMVPVDSLRIDLPPRKSSGGQCGTYRLRIGPKSGQMVKGRRRWWRRRRRRRRVSAGRKKRTTGSSLGRFVSWSFLYFP